MDFFAFIPHSVHWSMPALAALRRAASFYNRKSTWRFITLTTEISTSNPLALIADDMREVDRVIAQRLTTSVPLIGQISQYIIAAGGKRLRPALLLMICGALGYKGHHKYILAAVVELIHTATLLHDDVVDESTLRRGRPTANETFGNPASVLVGDFLHTRSFQMMVEVGSMRVLKILSDATNVIAEGEVQQLITHMMPRWMKPATCMSYAPRLRSSSKPVPSWQPSWQMHSRNRASLRHLWPGAWHGLPDHRRCAGLHRQRPRNGQEPGDDLREGKCTLPLIAAMQRGTPEQATIVRNAIEQGSTDQLDAVVEIVRSTGALDIARAAAHDEAQRAIDSLAALPDNEHTASLLQLASQLLERRT